MPTNQKTLYTIESPHNGWNGDLDCTKLEAAANKLPTAPCACGGAVWIRVWPEPQRGFAHLITYDSICSSCGWQPTTEDFQKPEAAAAVWNSACSDADDEE